MRKVRHKAANGLIGFTLISGVMLMMTHLFYAFVPGSYYVNYYKAYVADAKIGDPITFEFCRNARTTLKPVGIRSFISSEGAVVGEYSYQPNIQKGDDCDSIEIGTDRQPQIAGAYYIITDLTFTINGSDKSVRFITNTYQYKE